MDYSKFDFTKFSKEKWQEILTKIQGKHHYVGNVKVYPYSEAKKEIYPIVELECDFDYFETYYLWFSAFDVQSKGMVIESATKKWRKIMIEEFPLWYRSKLIQHLQQVKEQKIQQADEEYYKELEEIHNNYCN